MEKKKVYAVLSTTAIATLFTVALSSTSFAASTDILVQGKDGKDYQYNIDKLCDSFIGDQKLYNDFISKGDAKAYYEATTKQYIDINKIVDNFLQDTKNFDINKFTESAPASDDVPVTQPIQTVIQDANGNVVNGPVIPISNSDVASVSVVNKTTVQVVYNQAPTTAPTADKFAVTVNGKAVAAPTAVTKVDSDLTGKTYKLTIATLDGQQGDIAVNGTAAAVSAGKVYAFDYEAPVLQSVTAKGPTTLELQFNEKLDPSTTNIAAANFKITPIVGTGAITPDTAILDSTGTKVTLTLPSANALTVADYVVTLGAPAVQGGASAVNVTDVAGNGIYNGTQVSFRPTAAQLEDTAAPSLVSAVYNKVSGKLSLAMSKNITTVDTTKLSINGVALTASDVATVSGTDNKAVITLSDATKTAVNALTGNLTLTAAKDAYGDATVKTAGETFALSLQQPAVVKSAAYDQQSNKLTVTFDQPVTLKATNVLSIDDTDEASLAVVTKSMAVDADGNQADTTVANSTWTFDCSKDTDIASTIEGLTTSNLKAYILAGAVTNGASVDNVAGQDTYATGVSVAYTADTTKPTLAGVEYNNNTGNLVLTFSEKIDAATANTNAGNIKLFTADGTALTGLADLTGKTAVETGSTKTLTYNTLTTAEKTAIEKAINEGNAIKVTIDGTVAKDEANLMADATTYTTGAAVTYKDYIAPVLVQFSPSTPNAHDVDVSNANLIAVKFNEPVDSTTASNVNNYVISDSTGAKLAVTKVVPQAVDTTDGTETVLITTVSQTSGAPYTLAVNNVKDIAGNVITTPIVRSFNGSAKADTAKLTVDTLDVAAPANSKNDTLTIGFNTAPDTTKALDLNNYVVLQSDSSTDWTNATQISLTNAKASLVSGNPTKVQITLDAPNLQNGKYYKVVASNLTTVTGQALGTAVGDSDAVSAALVAAAPAAPTVTETKTATGAIKLVFNEELTGADVASNYTVSQPSTLVTKAAYSWDGKKATVVLDLSKPLTGVTAVTPTNVTSLAGAVVTPISAPAQLSDNVAPTVNTVTANINPKAADDNIVIAFNDPDVLAASANNVADYVIKDVQGNVIPSADYHVVLNDNAVSGNDAVTITFDGTADKAYNLQANGTYTVSISNILDESGNAMTPVTKTATLANNYKNGANVTATLNGSPLTADSTNVFTIPSTTTTLGDITLQTDHNIALKKASTNDFAVRVYDANGAVVLSDSSASSIKTLLFGQLDTSADDDVLKANISMSYSDLKTAMNNVSGTTVTSVQVDLFDLAGNKTTVTVNIK